MEQENTNEKLSEVEQFFYAAQKKLGGNLVWSDLSPMDQMQFVSACNILSQICSYKK